MFNTYFPSFNRAELVRGFEYLGQGIIVVPRSQESAYKKRYGKHVISIPDELDGNVTRKRNAVLELIKEREEDGYAWMIDDDFISLRRKKEGIKLTGDQALEQMERLLIMAKDMGATYGGFDYSSDNMKLKDFQPLSLTKPIFGAVIINANDGIKYDERFRICEDVEMWVQKMNQARRLLKDNQYVAVFFGEDGGADSVIDYNHEEQRKYADLINKKWGYGAMVWNKTRFEFKSKIKGA